MGTGLSLRGRHEAASADALLASVERWLARSEDDPAPRAERVDAGCIAIDLHPAAEPMVLTIDGAHVALDAKTGTAGPGYHEHACSFARELAKELSIRWTHVRDETAFFERGDRADLDQAALDWLRGAALEILARSAEGARGFVLAMPEGHAYEHDGLVATPLGPRDGAWARAVAEDPRAGIDVFAWWHARDARYYRDLAQVVMWRDVRWRPPLDGAERARLDAVATWIEKAFALDSTLELPWVEQAEILELLGEDSLRATRAKMRASSFGIVSDRIGYRRRPVRTRLSGGFSLEIPGEMAEQWDERGTWVASDGERTIWFTSLSAQPGPGERTPTTDETLASLPPLEGVDPIELQIGEIRGAAAFVDGEEEGVPLLRLDAHAAIGGDAAVGTLVFRDAEHRRWALETWGSLEHTMR